jgi:hypothetical protein
MTTTTRRLTDHLSTLMLVVLIGTQVTMLSYGARWITDAVHETRAKLAAVAAVR